MKQIQNVLFGAVKKVIPTYTVIEFEADFKANLLKSAVVNLKAKSNDDKCIPESCSLSAMKSNEK